MPPKEWTVIRGGPDIKGYWYRVYGKGVDFTTRLLGLIDFFLHETEEDKDGNG